MATATRCSAPLVRTAAVRDEELGTTPIITGHDLPCPWCGHSHQFLPCEDCACPPHKNYPGQGS